MIKMDFYGIGEETEEKNKEKKPSLLERIFKSKRKKEKTKEETEKTGFYGVELEETEKTGFYGIEEEKKEEKKTYNVKFEWYDYIIFIIEILLIFYTILVLLRIVPLF